MSVSGWETRSMASSMARDDHHGHRHQPPHIQYPTRAQFRSPTPQYEPRNHLSSTASQSSHVSRHHDKASRHSSFPVQQQQHMQYHKHAEEQQHYHQQRRQSMHRHERQEPAPYREQARQHANEQRRFSMSSSTTKRQPQPPLPYDQYGWQQEKPQYVEAQQAPSQYGYDEEYDRPPAHANGQRRSSVTRQPPQQYDQPPYHQQKQYEHPAPVLEDDYYEPPPPRAAPPPAPTEQAEQTQATDEEPTSIDDTLLGKRWSVHVISHLCQFQRQELGEYANELVKFLRGHAVMGYEQEFGYSVMIRFTSECVAFHVVETRDLHAEFLLERMEQPQRPENQRLHKDDALQDEDARQRSGAFVVYFPKAAEGTSTKLRTVPMNRNGAHRRSQQSQASLSSSDNSHGSNGNASQPRVDAKYACLVRGDEELMSWVSSWVQRRFQCSIDRHVVRITEENLRRVARNWVIESLEREDRVGKAAQHKDEKPRSSNGEALDHNGAVMQTKPPLLMKYRTNKTSDAVKAFTLTMPWATVRRVHAAMDGGVSSVLGSIPEVLDKLEETYFGNLGKDLAEMELVGIQMEEVEADVLGKIKFFKSSMMLSILQSYLDVFAVQQQAVPVEAETTTF